MSNFRFMFLHSDFLSHQGFGQFPTTVSYPATYDSNTSNGM